MGPYLACQIFSKKEVTIASPTLLIDIPVLGVEEIASNRDSSLTIWPNAYTAVLEHVMEMDKISILGQKKKV